MINFRKLPNIALVIDGVRMEQWISTIPTAGNPSRRWLSEDGRILVETANWRGSLWSATVDGKVLPTRYRSNRTAMQGGVAELRGRAA